MSNKQNKHCGFTIVELLITIAVIAVLASVVAVGYTRVQENAAKTAVLSTIRNGSELLEINFTKTRDYPPNLAGTEFVTNEDVQTVLYTNAPFVRKYSSLTPDQNAQLLLNSCRAHMPIRHGGSTYSTGCSFAGRNFHISGQRGSNVVLKGPSVAKPAFMITCSGAAGVACDAVTKAIIDDFTTQGGNWPITISNHEVPLPEPDQYIADESSGKANRFCLEARHYRFSERTVFHIMNDQSSPSQGPCADDPLLHYIPADEANSQ